MSDKTKLPRSLGGVVMFPVEPTHATPSRDVEPARAAGIATHLWVLDVLGHLKSYADAQNLARLSQALAECGDIALDELRDQDFGTMPPPPSDA